MINFFKRTLYLLYYLKEMDWLKFWQFIRHVKKQTSKSSLSIIWDAILSVYRYNIGLIDYFYFKFYSKDLEERKNWVGTGYKYEYDLIMNPVRNRDILENKIKFFKTFGAFTLHSFCTLQDLIENNNKAAKVLQNTSGKVVLKDALGQCGWNVEVLNTKEYTVKILIQYMKRKGFNLVEEFIIQHPDIQKLSNTGLNTVRIITQINNKNEVDFIGPTLRITVNSAVDNMAMGNMAAPIDLKSGTIYGAGVFQDIMKDPVHHHPVTKAKLIGFQIPHWNKVKILCRKAAISNTLNRSIGWDVAITKEGPAFVEGNHNWCKLLWQLPLQKGQKEILDDYKSQFKKEFVN